jgi:hypothetical protein
MRQEVGAILRQFALARRHADQLENVSNSIRGCARSTRC